MWMVNMLSEIAQNNTKIAQNVGQNRFLTHFLCHFCIILCEFCYDFRSHIASYESALDNEKLFRSEFHDKLIHNPRALLNKLVMKVSYKI